ncbi:MAG: UDP-N-acetylmuramoyl-L-alanyl-D-glutamate--2,6-diaminopimelate ligase, partial [Ignavibacteriae bacterium]|nr:UDP-N-acetylmuramoyl-L-alanyl-D-glutamate--2,6-diaminopimelate ligase [Ignavibacteriota bacterium]
MKLLSELISSISILTIHGKLDREVTTIEHDSRNCVENSLFVAILGTTGSDGHSFIGNAIENGASTIIFQTFPDTFYPHCTYILVDDTRDAAARLSNAFYDFPSDSLRIIGVTGTNGKTTITYLLKQLLESTGEKVGLIGTTGNMIGNELIPTNYTTPEAPELFRLLSKMKDASITTVVMEVSSHALILKRVLGVRFSVAFFTNLTHDHLDFHGSMDEYSKAKQILFNSLDSNSIAILNGDNEFAVKMKEDTASKVFVCGRNSIFDYFIDKEQLTIDRSEFNLNGEIYSTPLLGRLNIDKVAFRLALCDQLGIDSSIIKSILTLVKGAPGR